MRRPAAGGGDATERILEAAIGLLEDRGYEGFNTNAIAARAGVNVATVYRHFPDKFAVVRALAARLQAERADRVVDLLEEFATTADWRASVARIVAAVMATRRTQRGAAAVRRALQASPALLCIEREATGRLADALAAALQRRTQTLDPRRAQVLATATIVASTAMLDHAWDRPGGDDLLVDEAVRVVALYLAPELD